MVDQPNQPFLPNKNEPTSLSSYDMDKEINGGVKPQHQGKLVIPDNPSWSILVHLATKLQIDVYVEYVHVQSAFNYLNYASLLLLVAS